MRASIYLREIRYRGFYVFVSFIFVFLLSYFYAPTILFALFYESSLLDSRVAFLFSSLGEGLKTTFLVAFFAGLVFLLPGALYQIWCYVRPSRTRGEDKKLRAVLYQIGFGVFLTLGVTFKFILPILLPFFLSYEASYSVPTLIQPRFTSVLNFMGQTFLGVFFANLCVFFLPFFLQSIVNLSLRTPASERPSSFVPAASSQPLPRSRFGSGSEEAAARNEAGASSEAAGRMKRLACGFGDADSERSSEGSSNERGIYFKLDSRGEPNRLRGLISIFVLLFVSFLSPPDGGLQFGLSILFLIMVEFSFLVTCYRQVRRGATLRYSPKSERRSFR